MDASLLLRGLLQLLHRPPIRFLPSGPFAGWKKVGPAAFVMDGETLIGRGGGVGEFFFGFASDLRRF